MFHKKDLRTQDGEIAPGPRDAIADPATRVVGVVVNAADDHLAKGDQLRLADGLDGIPVLRPLLHEALVAGRVVVLTSDHGHILGSHQRVVAGGPEAGERYRLDDGRDVADDEVRLDGARVVRPGGGPGATVVAAADDRVRYTPMAKHGYHGGATLAEVLCPLLVLTPEGEIKITNPAACRMLGYAESDLLGLSIGDVFEEEEDAEAGAFMGTWLEALIRTGALAKIDARFIASDGRRVPILFSRTAIKDTDGTITDIICIAKDMSGYRRIHDDAVMEANGTTTSETTMGADHDE
ncbi:MAG: PAS domain-containing protein [Halochromatium sp.]